MLKASADVSAAVVRAVFCCAITDDVEIARPAAIVSALAEAASQIGAARLLFERLPPDCVPISKPFPSFAIASAKYPFRRFANKTNPVMFFGNNFSVFFKISSNY